MEEVVIGKEVGVLAKEKGFKIEPKNGWYRVIDTENHENSGWTNSVDRFLNDKNCYIECSQPVLQKWLRETHNIHIEIYFNQKNYNVTILGKGEVKDKGFLYQTYEKALEEGLLESLKLIRN